MNISITLGIVTAIHVIPALFIVDSGSDHQQGRKPSELGLPQQLRVFSGSQFGFQLLFECVINSVDTCPRRKLMMLSISS